MSQFIVKYKYHPSITSKKTKVHKTIEGICINLTEKNIIELDIFLDKNSEEFYKNCSLDISWNFIKTVIIPSNIRNVHCKNNPLTNIEFENPNNIILFNAINTQLTGFTRLPALKYLLIDIKAADPFYIGKTWIRLIN
jgi:uncharacterized protein YehS (DUF1456 family)